MSAKAGAFAFGFIREWIKAIREKRRAKRAARKAEKDAAGGEFFEDDKETSVLQGKLTYGVLGALLLAAAARALGDGVVTEADLNELGEAVLALVGMYGRWRATKA